MYSNVVRVRTYAARFKKASYDHTVNVLFSQSEIDKRIYELGAELTEAHQDDKTPVVFVCLLTGGFMFFSDLVKTILKVDIECDFMKAKSYEGKYKQGDVKLIKDLDTPIKDKHVYIVDDIYDTGNTLKAVAEYLQTKKPRSLNVVTLIKRKSAPEEILGADTVRYGFDINDEWIIGYGCDDEEGYFRNHPYIYAL